MCTHVYVSICSVFIHMNVCLHICLHVHMYYLWDLWVCIYTYLHINRWLFTIRIYSNKQTANKKVTCQACILYFYSLNIITYLHSTRCSMGCSPSWLLDLPGIVAHCHCPASWVLYNVCHYPKKRSFIISTKYVSL